MKTVARTARLCPWLRTLCGPLGLLLITVTVPGCVPPTEDDPTTTPPGDDDDATTPPGDDDDVTTPPGDDDDVTTPPASCEGQSLEIEVVSLDRGHNLRQHEVTLQGGCFDDQARAALVAEGGSNIPLQVITLTYPDSLIVQIPAVIPVGAYSFKVSRGATSTEAGRWFATSDVVVASYDRQMHLVDVSDVADPEEIITFDAPGQLEDDYLFSPTLNQTGTRVYFSEPEGIFGCDLPGCTAVRRVTPAVTDQITYAYAQVDASSSSDWLVFEATRPEHAAGMHDIYAAREDGSDYQLLVDMEYAPKVNSDTVDTWAVGQPVLAPDGQRLAFTWQGHCDNAGDPCENDFYTGISVMNVEDGTPEPIYFEPYELGLDFPQWTRDGMIIFQRYLPGEPAQELKAVDPTDGKVYPILPPGDQWMEFVWLAVSPIQDALLLEPFNTNDMTWFSFDRETSSYQASAGQDVQVPDPSNPGEFYHHYPLFSWFGWTPVE